MAKNVISFQDKFHLPFHFSPEMLKFCQWKNITKPQKIDYKFHKSIMFYRCENLIPTKKKTCCKKNTNKCNLLIRREKKSINIKYKGQQEAMTLFGDFFYYIYFFLCPKEIARHTHTQESHLQKCKRQAYSCDKCTDQRKYIYCLVCFCLFHAHYYLKKVRTTSSVFA